MPLRGQFATDAKATAPEASAEVLELQEILADLEDKLLRQRQLSSELQSGQQALQSMLAKLVARVETLEGRLAPLPDANGPAQMSGQVGAKAAAQKTPANEAVEQHWEQARRDGRYTLQLAGFYKPESLQWFVKRHRLGKGSAILETEYAGRRWYALLYGIYDSVGQAVAAARQLPPGLAAQRPWVRRIPPRGALSAQ